MLPHMGTTSRMNRWCVKLVFPPLDLKLSGWENASKWTLDYLRRYPPTFKVSEMIIEDMFHYTPARNPCKDLQPTTRPGLLSTTLESTWCNNHPPIPQSPSTHPKSTSLPLHLWQAIFVPWLDRKGAYASLISITPTTNDILDSFLVRWKRNVVSLADREQKWLRLPDTWKRQGLAWRSPS